MQTGQSQSCRRGSHSHAAVSRSPRAGPRGEPAEPAVARPAIRGEAPSGLSESGGPGGRLAASFVASPPFPSSRDRSRRRAAHRACRGAGGSPGVRSAGDLEGSDLCACWAGETAGLESGADRGRGGCGQGEAVGHMQQAGLEGRERGGGTGAYKGREGKETKEANSDGATGGAEPGIGPGPRSHFKAFGRTGARPKAWSRFEAHGAEGPKRWRCVCLVVGPYRHAPSGPSKGEGDTGRTHVHRHGESARTFVCTEERKAGRKAGRQAGRKIGREGGEGGREGKRKRRKGGIESAMQTPRRWTSPDPAPPGAEGAPPNHRHSSLRETTLVSP
jgi:hypothetical protein